MRPQNIDWHKSGKISTYISMLHQGLHFRPFCSNWFEVLAFQWQHRLTSGCPPLWLWWLCHLMCRALQRSYATKCWICVLCGFLSFFLFFLSFFLFLVLSFFFLSFFSPKGQKISLIYIFSLICNILILQMFIISSPVSFWC